MALVELFFWQNNAPRARLNARHTYVLTVLPDGTVTDKPEMIPGYRRVGEVEGPDLDCKWSVEFDESQVRYAWRVFHHDSSLGDGTLQIEEGLTEASAAFLDWVWGNPLKGGSGWDQLTRKITQFENSNDRVPSE